uniref:AlNc14C64G4607 protein n=1 Tax=Albugo laibachii Nc14 TaxID=890382 RepID=F0WD87_9STRA|nr:AlNc14C64G4607 [Albugo laibachii Nc14]|eukprot:CCA19159.1 AlNc14C64G4607 [Albugo laibachii Nc14]
MLQYQQRARKRYIHSGVDSDYKETSETSSPWSISIPGTICHWSTNGQLEVTGVQVYRIQRLMGSRCTFLLDCCFAAVPHCRINQLEHDDDTLRSKAISFQISRTMKVAFLPVGALILLQNEDAIAISPTFYEATGIIWLQLTHSSESKITISTTGIFLEALYIRPSTEPRACKETAPSTGITTAINTIKPLFLSRHLFKAIIDTKRYKNLMLTFTSTDANDPQLRIFSDRDSKSLKYYQEDESISKETMESHPLSSHYIPHLLSERYLHALGPFKAMTSIERHKSILHVYDMAEVFFNYGLLWREVPFTAFEKLVEAIFRDVDNVDYAHFPCRSVLHDHAPTIVITFEADRYYINKKKSGREDTAREVRFSSKSYIIEKPNKEESHGRMQPNGKKN